MLYNWVRRIVKYLGWGVFLEGGGVGLGEEGRMRKEGRGLFGLLIYFIHLFLVFLVCGVYVDR